MKDPRKELKKAKVKFAKEDNKKESKSDSFSFKLVIRGIIIALVLSGSLVPSSGPFDIASFYAAFIYLPFIIYYVVKLLTSAFSKKPERKKNLGWYIVILIILFIPFRFPIQSMAIDNTKDFAIKFHDNCNKKGKCSEVKNLPWTNGRFFIKKSGINTFEFSHWHMENVHHFYGGVGKDLTFEYYWADHFDKKKSIYKKES